MTTSKIIGIILILGALALGYIGINKIADSTQQINLFGLKIDASNESGQQQGYLYVGAAVVIFCGGVYAMKKSG